MWSPGEEVERCCTTGGGGMETLIHFVWYGGRNKGEGGGLRPRGKCGMCEGVEASWWPRGRHKLFIPGEILLCKCSALVKKQWREVRLTICRCVGRLAFSSESSSL